MIFQIRLDQSQGFCVLAVGLYGLVPISRIMNLDVFDGAGRLLCRTVPTVAPSQGDKLLNEPVRQCLQQCGNGELLLIAQDRTKTAQGLSLRKTRPMCSTTMSPSTVPSGGTRRWGISALLSLNRGRISISACPPTGGKPDSSLQ
jgi:hypothetical protein